MRVVRKKGEDNAMGAEILEVAKWITGVAAGVGILWAIISRVQSIVRGLLCILRENMLRTYYKCAETNTIRQYEKENFLLSYAAYRALGGNSFIEELHDEVKTWEVRS